MARPWRDPASGSFYLWTRVPRDVLPIARGTNAVLPVGDDNAPVRIGEMIEMYDSDVVPEDLAKQLEGSDE